jgi:hypothetical protein
LYHQRYKHVKAVHGKILESPKVAIIAKPAKSGQGGLCRRFMAFCRIEY